MLALAVLLAAAAAARPPALRWTDCPVGGRGPVWPGAAAACPARAVVLLPNGTTLTLARGYDTVAPAPGGCMLGVAALGCGLTVRDRLCPRVNSSGGGASAWELARKVEAGDGGVSGFRSEFELTLVPDVALAAAHVFMPGVWWDQNTAFVPPWAFGADKSMQRYLVRTDRLAAPLAAVAANVSGAAAALWRAPGSVSMQTVAADPNATLLIDARLGYDAIGRSPSFAEL